MTDFELEVEQNEEVFEIDEDNTPYVNFGSIGGQVEENQTLVDYIDEHGGGGSIDTIKKNGVELPIVDKSVDISVPTNVSELTNDSDYQNSTQVDDAITSKGYDTIADVNSKIATAKSEVEAEIPTKVSELTNDSNFQNANQVDSAITSKGYQTASQVNSIVEGKGYQTAQQVEDRIVGKGYDTISNVNSKIASAKSEIEAEIPTKVSELTNDSGYQTASQVDSAITSKDYATNTKVDNETQNLQQQIDSLVSKSDVVDVVGTYEELENYDTSTLANNDVVKVLDDETHSNQRSYYRWVITANVGEWEYIGSESVGYTKAETDTLLNAKVDTTTFNSTINTINTNKADLSYVNTQLGNVDTQLALKENTSNKTNVLDSGSTNQQYPSAKATYDSIQDVREVAEGKTKSYVVSTAQNPSFDTQANDIEVQNFTDLSGNVISGNTLKIGDTVYVKELNVPDRWLSQYVDLVPSPYMRTAYLYRNTANENNLTNYIDTQQKMSSNSKIEVEFMLPTSAGSYTFLLGLTRTLGIYFESGGNKLTFWKDSSVSVYSTDLIYNHKYNVVIDIKNGEIYVDNVLVASEIEFTNLDTTRNLWIFGNSTLNGNLIGKSKAQFYKFKHYVNDELVSYLLPARDTREEVSFGAYDLVRGIFISTGENTHLTNGEDIESGNIKLSKLETAKPNVLDIQDNGTSILNLGIADVGYKVDKEEGKGLSTNDFTNEDKAKISLIDNKENTSNKTNVIDSGSTTTQYPSAKAVYDLFDSIVNGNEVAW